MEASGLRALLDPGAPAWLREVSTVGILRQVWMQNYQWTEGKLNWRAADNLPPAALYSSSPHDLEAHDSKKRTTSWVGHKVHLTETCEQDRPHLITYVDTTTVPVSDDARTATIHAGLQQHLVDTGYVDAQLLHQSQTDYGIDLVGPTRADYHWRSQQKAGFAAGQFQIDWAAGQATCPEGHTSISWTPALDNRKNEVIKIKFSMKGCQPYPSRSLCTHHAISVVPSPCAKRCTIARSSAPAHGLRWRSSKRSMLDVLGWKAPSRKGFGRWACDAPATSVRTGPICSTWPRCGYEYRSFSSLAGWRAACQNQALGFSPIASPSCLTRLRGFASSIER